MSKEKEENNNALLLLAIVGLGFFLWKKKKLTGSLIIDNPTPVDGGFVNDAVNDNDTVLNTVPLASSNPTYYVSYETQSALAGISKRKIGSIM